MVIDKYKKKGNHDQPCVEITQSDNKIVEVGFSSWGSGIWSYVQVGDSLIKPKGELDIVIKRKGESPRKFKYLD